MTANVLRTVVQAAVDVTGAAAGWVLTVAGDRAEVGAAAGAGAEALVGTRVDVGTGSAGFVLSSGQPLAVAPRPDDPLAAEGLPAALGRRATSILSVPCSDDDGVLGALELVDKAGGVPFSFDDVELATLLAGIAAAALAEGGGSPPRVPEPGQLAGELARLAATDRTRYAAVAVAVAALIAGG